MPMIVKLKKLSGKLALQYHPDKVDTAGIR